MYCTGFPKKDGSFSKLKSIPDLLSCDKEGEMIKNIEYKYFSTRAYSV